MYTSSDWSCTVAATRTAPSVFLSTFPHISFSFFFWCCHRLVFDFLLLESNWSTRPAQLWYLKGTYYAHVQLQNLFYSISMAWFRVWNDTFFRLYLSWCSSLAGEVLAPPSLSQLHSYSLPCAEFEMKVGVASMLTVRAVSLISIKDYCSHWHHKGGRVEKTEQLWPYLVWASTHVKAYMWHTWGKWWKAKYVLLKTVAFLNLKDFIQRNVIIAEHNHIKNIKLGTTHGFS